MIGEIPTTFDVAQDQPWKKGFRFWLGRGKSTPAPITGGKAWLKPRACGSSAVPLTVANGRILLDENVVCITMSQADLAAMDAGTYDLEVQGILTSNVRQLRGVVNLRPGLA